MDRESANQILEALAWMEIPIGKLCRDIESGNMTDEERKKMRSAVSDVFSGHFTLHMMILNRFPELDADKAGKESYNQLIEKYCTDEITFEMLRPNEKNA